MKDDSYMNTLVKDPWDTFRDLEKVFNDPYSQENDITYTNSLLIDSDPRKVQKFLTNSLTCVEYTK